jgi:hypothetical protein
VERRRREGDREEREREREEGFAVGGLVGLGPARLRLYLCMGSLLGILSASRRACVRASLS